MSPPRRRACRTSPPRRTARIRSRRAGGVSPLFLVAARIRGLTPPARLFFVRPAAWRCATADCAPVLPPGPARRRLETRTIIVPLKPPQGEDSGKNDDEDKKEYRDVLQTSVFVPTFLISYFLVISYDVQAKHSTHPAHYPSNLSILISLLTT